MANPEHVDQTFQTAAILAAISVPLLAAVSAVAPMAGNALVVRSIALAGFLFLVAALFSFLELLEIGKLPRMTISDNFQEFASSKGFLLAGLVTLLVFQIAQSRTIF